MRSSKTVVKAAAKGSVYAVAFVLVKLAFGVRSDAPVSVITLAILVGGIGGAAQHLLQGFSSRGALQYYASWALTGGIVGVLFTLATLLPYHDDGMNLEYSLGIMVASVLAGLVVGAYASYLRDREKADG